MLLVAAAEAEGAQMIGTELVRPLYSTRMPKCAWWGWVEEIVHSVQGRKALVQMTQ